MSTEVEHGLAHEIASLDDLGLDGLRLRWQARFLRTAPVHLSRALLLRLYAYRLQAKEHGDLGATTIQLLDRLGRAKTDHDKSIPLPAVPNGRGQLRAGTVLVREHAGISHHVTVAQDGYHWNGQSFPSLSQVATAITGTRWNGPRFFGIPSGKATL